MKNTKQDTLTIRPVSKLPYFNLRELFEYRHLLWSMVWKKIRLDFDDMYLGFFWAIARPLTMVAIFVFIRDYSGANMYVNIAYPLYIYSGLALWFQFREATMATARSVKRDAGLIKKVYYPRLITPMVPAISQLYNLSIAMVPLVCMMLWYGVYPGWLIILLPMVLLQVTVFVLGLGMVFACLVIVRTDFEKFLNLSLYIGLFVSPVLFAPEMIPEKGRIIFFLNPMAGTLQAFRSCLFHGYPFPGWQFAYSVFMTIALLAVGITMYRRAEVYFADRL
jgi:lipopolysaccharide transport system permease protein